VSCPFEHDVLLLADGELATERRYVVEAHLATCESCAAIEESLDLVERTLREAPCTPLGVVGPALAALEPRTNVRARVAVAAGLLIGWTIALSLAWPPAQRAVAPAEFLVSTHDTDDIPLPRALSPTILEEPDAAAVAERIVRAGAPGRSMLRRALASEDRDVQRRALIVANFAPASADIAALSAMLGDEEFGPRAARLLGQIGSASSVPALAQALEESCGVEAREALVAIGGARAVEALERRAATDPDAFDALARTDARHAARFLMRSKGDEKTLRSAFERRATVLVPELRRELAAGQPGAARLLGWARDEESVPALARLAHSRPTVVAALVEIGTDDAIEAAFEACYRSGETAFAFEGAAHAESFLLRKLEQGTAAEGRTALALLEHCGGAATLQALDARDWNVATARSVIRAAGAIGGKRGVDIVVRWKDRPALHDEIVLALGEARDNAAVPHLRELARHRRHAPAAAIALGKIATRDSVFALIELLERDRVAERAHHELILIAGVDLGKQSKPWRRWWDSQS